MTMAMNTYRGRCVQCSYQCPQRVPEWEGRGMSFTQLSWKEFEPILFEISLGLQDAANMLAPFPKLERTLGSYTLFSSYVRAFLSWAWGVMSFGTSLSRCMAFTRDESYQLIGYFFKKIRIRSSGRDLHCPFWAFIIEFSSHQRNSRDNAILQWSYSSNKCEM